MNQLIAEAEQKGNFAESDSLNMILFSEIRESERLQEYIQMNYPAYYQMQFQFENTDIESLTSQFPNSTVVEYFWGEEAIYAIRFDKNHKVCHKIKNNQAIEKRIRSFIKLCNSKQSSVNSDYSSFVNCAYLLFKDLLSPLIEDSTAKPGKQENSIIIVPDGLLSNLPFEALIQNLPDSNVNSYKNLDYLVNNYEIGYSFSSNFLSFTQRTGNKSKVKKILAFGYFGDKTSLIDSNNRSFSQVSLPGSKKELNGISKYFPGIYLTGNEATESNFKKLCTAYDAIHLAIHGTYDSLNNYNTYLIFNSIGDTLEDGKLYNYDLFPMKLEANLAVLSACETGLGKNNPGEGLLSMGWGFAYAGCKSLIVSLWKANDRSTSNLMEQFYKQLSISNDVNASLRHAKRAYLSNADEYTAHPRYWAAFVNYGNIKPSGIAKKNQLLIYESIIVFISLIVLATFLLRKSMKRKLFFFRRRHSRR